MADFDSATKCIRNIEKEILLLQSEVLKTREGLGLEDDNVELKKLMEENTRLKHRLEIVQSVSMKTMYGYRGFH